MRHVAASSPMFASPPRIREPLGPYSGPATPIIVVPGGRGQHRNAAGYHPQTAFVGNTAISPYFP